MGYIFWSVLNISQIGGGADLASKAQILAYYEMVLADLKVIMNSDVILSSNIQLTPTYMLSYLHVT